MKVEIWIFSQLMDWFVFIAVSVKIISYSLTGAFVYHCWGHEQLS